MTPNVIVVVEDEPRARLAAIDACERAGFEVADFGRTNEALAFAADFPDRIAALLTDIDVPGDQDGIDLAVVIRQQWPHVRVIVTSGRYGDEQPAGLPPSARFLAKPWTSATLLQHMREIAH